MKKDLNYKDLLKMLIQLYWTMAVVLDPKFYGKRDIIIKKLLKKGIETRNGFFFNEQVKNFQKIFTLRI